MKVSYIKECTVIPAGGINYLEILEGTEPLTLVRQGHENDFQVVWPEKGDFEISPSESFYFRDGERLIFSKWYEDPYYREETVIRAYPSGEVLEEIKGAVVRMPDGQKWMLEQEKT